MHGQPRKQFDPDALEELAQSIRESGVIQPLVVRALDNGRFGLVAGERRWRAAQLAGLDSVPVVVRDVSDNEAFVLALIENVQREDLNPIEEAEAYRQLLDDQSLTQGQLASRVGKSRVAVANSLRLLNLVEAVRGMVADGDLSSGHARAVLSVPEELQQEFAQRIKRDNLTVRKAEELARKLRESSTEEEADDESESAEDSDEGDDLYTPQVRHVERQLRERFSAKVRIKRNADHSGKIEISFASTDGLNALIDEMLGNE
jgi:ParB family chromosome partitioning protein